MAKHARFKCLIFITITIFHSSANSSTETFDDRDYQEFVKQDQHISNVHNTFPEIESETQTLEGLTRVIDELTNQQEDSRYRTLFCSTDIKQKLNECTRKCSGVIYCLQTELDNYISACRTNTRQTCSIEYPCSTKCVMGVCDDGKCKCFNSYTGDDCSIPPPSPPTPSPVQECGIANTAMPRRIGGRPNRKHQTRRRPNRKRPNRKGPNKNKPSKPNRIIGGVKVDPPRKYPWQVRFTSPSGIPGIIGICGGSIINTRWILTAAHCLGSSTQGYQVIVGEHDHSTDSEDDPINTKVYSVEMQVPHPDFETYGAGQLKNDFALLKLTTDIPFNDVIRPVCLPEDDSKTYAGVTATVSGWGVTELGSTSNVLMEVNVPIDAQSDCTGWGDPNINPISEPVTNVELCAGPTTTPPPGKDSCQGDSGGPLVVKEGNKYIQVGVVSYGFGCGIEPFSAIYARVSKVLNWIQTTSA